MAISTLSFTMKGTTYRRHRAHNAFASWRKAVSSSSFSQMPNETLRAICDAVDVPIVAIGGINRGNILKLAGSGVDGVALVSALFSNAGR